MPGLTPQVANESEGRRGLSHSERDCGVAKLWRLLGFLLAMGMMGNERKRRGFSGKESGGGNLWKKLEVGLGEEIRMKREKAVKMKSDRDAGDDDNDGFL